MDSTSPTPAHSPDGLTPQQWSQLVRDGFLYIPNALSPEAVADLRRERDALFGKYPFGRHEDTLEAFTCRDRRNVDTIDHLMFETPVFERLATMPLVRSTVERVLGVDNYLKGMAVRRVWPGTPRLDYHKDDHGQFGFALLLDDIGVDEGGTTFVPGSHLGSPPPLFSLRDVMAAHPREVQTTGQVGSLFFFFFDTWHSRAVHQGSKPTAEMLTIFVNRNYPPNHRLVPGGGPFREADYAALSAETRHLLRPFDGRPKQVGGGLLASLIHNDHAPTCDWARDFLYCLFAFRKSGSSTSVRDWPHNVTALNYELHPSAAAYLTQLDWWLVARGLVLTVLRKFKAGRSLLEWIKGRQAAVRNGASD